ncbi:MAG: hypothetical protein IKD85_06400, partial [Firmicutes bacterium]|nr:hypothetical protein [Bacillota bacterium]
MARGDRNILRRSLVNIWKLVFIIAILYLKLSGGRRRDPELAAGPRIFLRIRLRRSRNILQKEKIQGQTYGKKLPLYVLYESENECQIYPWASAEAASVPLMLSVY